MVIDYRRPNKKTNQLPNKTELFNICQWVMDNILRGIQHESALVYLEDILVVTTLKTSKISYTKFRHLDNSDFLIDYGQYS